MRMFRSILIGVMLLTMVVVASAQRGGGGAPMTMSIAGFADGTDIPVKFTQAAEQVSPAITWANPPAGTVSFLLHFHDMEVVQQRGLDDQVHWLVWNIPASATGLPEGIPAGPTIPNGAKQISATGPQYRGPGAPATGPKHHYTFELYALDINLDVAASANAQPGPAALETRAAVMKALPGHILGKAVYMGLFKRPQ